MEEGDFWTDSDKAQEIIKECNLLKRWTIPYKEVSGRFEDAASLLPEVEKDSDLFDELILELDQVEAKVQDLEI